MILRKGLLLLAVFLGLFFFTSRAFHRPEPFSYQVLWPSQKKLALNTWYHSEKGFVIVVYMGAADWEGLEPWLEFWEELPLIKAIVLVDYGEEARPLWEQLPIGHKFHKTYGVERFDGSILRVMPPGALPASYVIEAGGYAAGPFETYEDLTLSIGVFEAEVA